LRTIGRPTSFASGCLPRHSRSGRSSRSPIRIASSAVSRPSTAGARTAPGTTSSLWPTRQSQRPRNPRSG
jgi:hypothetical protein